MAIDRNEHLLIHLSATERGGDGVEKVIEPLLYWSPGLPVRRGVYSVRGAGPEYRLSPCRAQGVLFLSCVRLWKGTEAAGWARRPW